MNNCINKINSYLKDESVTFPFFVNIESAEQKSELLDYYSVSDNIVVHIADYAKKDCLPNVMELMDRIKKATNNTIVFGLTTYLKLISAEELQKTMLMLSNMSISKRIVIVCYHCDEILKALVKKDLRVAQRIATSDISDEVVKPHITFITPEYSQDMDKVIDGIEFLPESIEDTNKIEVVVKTNKSRVIFSNGQYAISSLDTPLDILQNRYQELNIFKYRDSDGVYWKYLLELSNNVESFQAVVVSHFGEINNYEYSLQEWHNYVDNLQWLLFITMKVFPDAKNEIIKSAIDASDSHFEVIRNIVRVILAYEHDSRKFLFAYNQWRSLRYRLSIPEEEIADYCEYVDQKGKFALFYLSDLTKIEKEKAIKTIGLHQTEYNDEMLLAVLKNNFSDFYDYVCPFFYNNNLLDNYFSQYTMQKLRNVIYPEFEKLVDIEAEEQHFVELPTRAEIVGSMDKQNSILYFVDALGVEFLNYILKKCEAKGLFAEPKVGKCNLPSITEKNKEFLDTFKLHNVEIVDFIKQIDKDKHEVTGDYSFEKSEFPIHLIDELEVIDKVLANINTKLGSNKYKQAYIVSDHGASRLAVIKKSILPIESNRTGTHGGRVSENNEYTKNIPHAVHEGNLCILAGYDRFDGSRPATVETHGGATLEEVVVPIIRITKNHTVWEFEIMNENNKVMFSYRTKPILVVWSKNELNNMSVKVNGKPYVGISDSDKKTFRFELEIPEKACECVADFYVSNNLVKSDLKFRLEREGLQKSKGFGNMMFGGSKNQ